MAGKSDSFTLAGHLFKQIKLKTNIQANICIHIQVFWKTRVSQVDLV